jgi:glycerol-3-phosphate acyltransferase PlsY
MGRWTYALPVVAYLYGSVPFGFIAAKLIKGVDIRQTGSRSIGATNAARVLGLRFFPVVFLLDLSKGLLPTLAADRSTFAGHYDPGPLVVATALAAMLGHVFPLYLRFKGGKAVATSTGVFLVLAPAQLAAAGIAWALMFIVSRYVSLSSIAAALALVTAVWVSRPHPLGSGLLLTILSTVGGCFVVWLHRGNIRRLLAGTEHKIGAPRSLDDSPPGTGHRA